MRIMKRLEHRDGKVKRSFVRRDVLGQEDYPMMLSQSEMHEVRHRWCHWRRKSG